MPATEISFVRDWLKALGTLCAGALTIDEAVARVAGYAPMLAAKFKSDAFDLRSLDAVAVQSKFFPSYAEVVGRLQTWVEENALQKRYAQKLITGDSRIELSDDQLAHVECVLRRLQAGKMPSKALGVLHQCSGKHAVARLLEKAPMFRPLCEARGWLR